MDLAADWKTIAIVAISACMEYSASVHSRAVGLIALLQYLCKIKCCESVSGSAFSVTEPHCRIDREIAITGAIFIHWLQLRVAIERRPAASFAAPFENGVEEIGYNFSSDGLARF